MGASGPHPRTLTADSPAEHADSMSAPQQSNGPFVDRYHVLRELGRGGMGTVHLAFQIDLERHLALKRLLPENIGLASAEGWFKREYQALAAIRHQGVPAIYDRGQCGESVAYFTMEYIDGPSLRAALNTRAFETVEAITIVIELARILAATHAVGVIHRDVKPANIILEAGGRVRLIDFGICFFLPRFKARISNLRSIGENEYQTGPLEIAGSVGYTDPALMNGHPPSVQSDIFSACVILYEMLARRRLYDERLGGFHQIDSGEFAPELAPIVGEIRRGSQLLPRDRHASMDELIRGLEIARSAVVRARSEPDKTTSRVLPFALSVVNLTVLLALGTWWALGRMAHDDPPPAPVVVSAAPVLDDIAASVDGTAGTVATRRETVAPARVEIQPEKAIKPGLGDPAPTTDTVEVVPGPGETTSTASQADKRRRAGPAAPIDRSFATAMARLEPAARRCARAHGVAQDGVNVEVRRGAGGHVDSVRVWDMSTQHPFVRCINKLVRGAGLPREGAPVELFKFFGE